MFLMKQHISTIKVKFHSIAIGFFLGIFEGTHSSDNSRMPLVHPNPGLLALSILSNSLWNSHTDLEGLDKRISPGISQGHIDSMRINADQTN